MADVLVVGAAGGVGSAVAEILAKRGEAVFGTVLNATEADMAKAKVPSIKSVELADLGNAEAVAETVGKIIEGNGGIDAVIVCAAISPYAPLETTSLALLRRTYEINTVAGLAIFHAAIPALRKSKGRIIFVSSMAGKTGMQLIGAYTSSKYALEGMADVMRREVAPQGVKVVVVEPGGIKTGMVEEQLRNVDSEVAKLSAEQKTRYEYLYRAFQKLAGDSHNSTSSSAEFVAEIVIQALDAPEPKARYIAGADAEGLLALAHASSDAELDGVFAGMFPQTAA